ncbi:prolyl oligopeptidase-like protein [Xylariales sp. PMI_506]|nr:prolyl oligopeptidase-like protein [Xylariales sp. PMI_506]
MIRFPPAAVIMMGRSKLFASLSLLGGLLSKHAAAVSSSPVVTTPNGQLRGTVSDYVEGVNVFKGIRYGESTAGDKRWTIAETPGKWTGIVNATEFGNTCPQSTGSIFAPGPIEGDEDCLFLNIWTPDNFTSTSNLPVYFWIYGGRFAVGSGGDSTYDGSGLAQQGIVVVTINYRLDVLGFLAHPDLDTESGIPSGNYGLHDQLAALTWVTKNIQSFGGNPKKITVGGQSAGAASTLLLVYSPLAKGLFQGAIAESGARAPQDPLTSSLASSYRNKTAAENEGVEYLAELNVSTIAEARSLDVDTLLNTGGDDDPVFAGTAFSGNQAYTDPPLYRPVLDGYYLPTTIEQTLAQHRQNDVPIITGNNQDESGANPADYGIIVDLAAYEANNSAIFGPIGLDTEFFDLFPADTDGEANDQNNNFYRNQSLISTYLWANAWAAGGGRSNVYTYYWTHAPPGQTDGVFHGSEINYAMRNIPYATDFEHATLNWTSTDIQIMDVMSSYWINFIRTGNPNGCNLATWNPSTSAAKTTMQLGDAWKTIPVGSSAAIELVEEYFSHEIVH